MIPINYPYYQFVNQLKIPIKNKNKMYSSPLFTSLEGVTGIIENLLFCTPITIFNTLFNDKIMDLIVFQTNLYAQQK